MSADRRELKYRLANTRTVKHDDGKHYPECAYCGEPILGAPDMHEVLLTKQHSRSLSKEAQFMMDYDENCVLVHGTGNASPCHKSGWTATLQYAEHLVRWMGRDALIKYIEEVRPFFKSQDWYEERMAIMRTFTRGGVR